MADSGGQSEEGVSTQSPSQNLGNYAFLNHSPETFPKNLPPTIDDKPLARQRRRRTSPEDQAILEAAYNRDSKPDKAARLELVNQVALGEKEVQIWFQNRRQTSRRKSRPLLPHEVAQYHLSKSGTLPPISLAMHSNEADQVDLSTERVDHPSSEASEEPVSPAEESKSSHLALQDDSANDRTHSSSSAVGYLANRRSVPSLRPSDQDVQHSADFQTRQSHEPNGQLKKSSSTVRLSLTSDGAARVITKNFNSPSPPRRDTTLPTNAFGLPVSAHSASSSSALAAVPALQRSSSGRSRDSRTWEFWCDKDARLDLQDKAQKDASGSAAGAIGLLRSNSGRRILGSIPVKRNSIGMQQPQLQKRSKLGRSHTSHETSAITLHHSPATAGPELKKRSSLSIQGLDGDWNKENQPPMDDNTLPRFERSYSAVEQRSIQRPAMASLSRQSERITTDRKDPEKDPEVAAFMRGGRSSRSSQQEEDMDCIQGLLSLSQGNWR